MYLQPTAPKFPPKRYIVDLVHEPGTLLTHDTQAGVAYMKLWTVLTPPDWRADPPENCHLTVKKLPKTWLFFKKNCQKFSFFSKKIAIFWKKLNFLAIFFEKMSSFWQFFDSQMAIFRRVRSSPVCCTCLYLIHYYTFKIYNFRNLN